MLQVLHLQQLSLGLPACYRGPNEVVTYSFVPEEINSLFVSGEQIKLKNPVSADLACMRSTTLLGLLLSAQNELKDSLSRSGYLSKA